MASSNIFEDNRIDETFYGCYLLNCQNPCYKGRTYIGFTVDPNRRIKQHNEGSHKGGAKKTSGKGPWDMVLIVHGFPNEISALRFEWAWQNPKQSRRLRHVQGKSKKENNLSFCLRVLSAMLNAGPWKRLALTIRWLKQEYQVDLPHEPPLHMAVAYGPLEKRKRGKSTKEDVDRQPIFTLDKCNVCRKQLKETEQSLVCLTPGCNMKSHLPCLAQMFLSKDKEVLLLPVSGACPTCGQDLLWGDLIRYQRQHRKKGPNLEVPIKDLLDLDYDDSPADCVELH